MKAVIWSKYGPPGVLHIKEVKKPVPRDDEILVKVIATSVTSGDCELRRFHIAPTLWPWLRLYIGVIRPKRIKILGQEMAGVVESVGMNVNRFSPGDEVMGVAGMGMGTYAEYVRIHEDSPVIIKPEGLPFEQAAVLPVGGLEALHFIDMANIREGQNVLINGAGGSIGTIALQLVKLAGAHATCVDIPEKFDMLIGLGADAVIDHTKDNFWTRDAQFDVVFDLVGNSPLFGSLRSVKKGGTLVLGNSGPFAPKMISFLVSMVVKKRLLSNMAKGKREELEKLSVMLTTGMIKIVIDRRFPLHQIVDAHNYVESGRKKGNVVINVIEE